MEIRVLLIDDDKLIHKIVGKSLDKEFHLMEAFNGAEGVEKARTELPDLILLDVEMPGKNGYETCEELKSIHETTDIPVVFLSGKTSIHEHMLGYEAGAEDYLNKPFNNHELNAKLKVIAQFKLERDSLKSNLEEAHSTALDAITGSSELGLVMRYVELSYGIRQLDTLASKLLELTETFGLHSSVMFMLNDQPTYFSSTGLPTPIEQKLLTECHNNNRFIDFGCRTIINYPKVSLLIKNMPLEDPEKYGRYKDVFPTVLGATDAKIRLMETNELLTAQGDKTQRAFSNIRASLRDLFVSSQQHQQQALEIMSGLLSEMQFELPKLALEDDQEEYILNLVETSLEGVTSEIDSNKELQNALSSVLNEMKVLVSELEHVVEATQQDLSFLQGVEAEPIDEEGGYTMDVELF